MAVTFNGVTKTMTVTNVSSIDVQRNLYSSWKRWVRLSDNAKYLQAMRPVGGDSIGGGQSSPAYFFLMNDWKVLVDGINVDFKLNLYCEETTNSTFFPFIISGNGAASYKVSDSPIITISSGSGLSPEQDATLTNIDTNVVDIRDEAIGNMLVDPVLNTLTLYRTDGSVFKVYNLVIPGGEVPPYTGRTAQ